MNLNLVQDWQTFDNQETVSITSTRTTQASGGNAIDADIQGLRRALTFKELAASAGKYTGKDISWVIGASQTTFDYKPGDTLLDGDNITWTILEASFIALRSSWKLITRNLVLAFDLRQTVSVYRPANLKDAAGGRLPSFPSTAVYANIPAAIQEITAETVEERGKTQIKHTYTIIVGKQLAVTNEDQLRDDATGTIYQIMGYHNPNRIDELPVIDASLTS